MKRRLGSLPAVFLLGAALCALALLVVLAAAAIGDVVPAAISTALPAAAAATLLLPRAFLPRPASIRPGASSRAPPSA